MSNRQLEQLRETLDSIVEDLCNREQAVDKEQAHLLEKLNELDQRQSELKSLDEIVAAHQATEMELADQLRSLIASLESRASAEPPWITTALQQLEDRLLLRLQDHKPQTPTLEETVRELEKAHTRSVGSLLEQLTTSLQTAIAVQLAPLSDDLPERLQTAVSAAIPTATPSLPVAMPELAREIEKFESRSMASMAARMTAGLQTALANQWSALAADLPGMLAQAVGQVQLPAPAQPASPIAAVNDDSEQYRKQIAELTSQLAAVRSSLSETENLLAEALEHHSDAPAAASSDSDPLIEALRTEITELRSLLNVKERDSVIADELRDEINRLRSDSVDQGGDSEDHKLRERLEVATCEIIDLRSQNEELSERLAKLQISYSPHGHMPHLGQEGLSWEERKKLLLEQLNAETDAEDASVADDDKRLKIEEIIKTTDAELARRDREIAELRSLLEQQADAREGVAVGAAAVAQLVESDELVQEEREKLRNLQKSWDEKLRQAEIDVSMERAKIARERLQLEEQKQELEAALHALQANQLAGDPKDKAATEKGRKWLSRLGLKEEK